MRFLLSVIAVCLVMITAKLYIPEAKAQDMGAYDLFYDANFRQAVGLVVSDDCKATIYETVYVYDPEYVENINLDFVSTIKC